MTDAKAIKEVARAINAESAQWGDGTLFAPEFVAALSRAAVAAADKVRAEENDWSIVANEIALEHRGDWSEAETSYGGGGVKIDRVQLAKQIAYALARAFDIGAAKGRQGMRGGDERFVNERAENVSLKVGIENLMVENEQLRAGLAKGEADRAALVEALEDG